MCGLWSGFLEFDVQICHRIGSQDVSIFSARSSESNIKTYYCKVCCGAKKSLFLAVEISLEYNKDACHRQKLINVTNALCSKSNGRCDIKAEKREELESKSSHKSDIWPPAASKK